MRKCSRGSRTLRGGLESVSVAKLWRCCVTNSAAKRCVLKAAPSQPGLWRPPDAVCKKVSSSLLIPLILSLVMKRVRWAHTLEVYSGHDLWFAITSVYESVRTSHSKTRARRQFSPTSRCHQVRLGLPLTSKIKNNRNAKLMDSHSSCFFTPSLPPGAQWSRYCALFKPEHITVAWIMYCSITIDTSQTDLSRSVSPVLLWCHFWIPLCCKSFWWFLTMLLQVALETSDVISVIFMDNITRVHVGKLAHLAGYLLAVFNGLTHE